ncbi:MULTISPECIES: hypothetical protein [Calothrix]|uniref:Uncharacterized protein n=2 Tax=Calothrix TaxID=1186 RepID=A0ABR8A822_9CYAN|nr:MULTISPECIES: hypothetical protein [Calothrix]MBD2195969.1 hypothetical protein [Calothrix parietina FACHB-288]MBD2224541.1 hypothetical protein [Calothrix anomala FACHB-343]
MPNAQCPTFYRYLLRETDINLSLDLSRISDRILTNLVICENSDFLR